MKKSTNPFLRRKRIFHFLLVLVIFGFQTGCFAYYFKVKENSSLDSQQLNDLKAENKYFIFHNGYVLWNLIDPKIESGHLTGKIVPLPGEKERELNLVKNQTYSPHRYYKNQQRNTSDIVNDVHIYGDLPHLLKDSANIPLSQIRKIEIYNKNKAATTASWVLGTVGITATVVVLVASIGTSGSNFTPSSSSSGSSCPFVYTYDGTQYSFAGEIYGGAVYPALERHDYIHLPRLLPVENNYYLYLKNQQREVQFTNLAELYVFDHPENSFVYMDKYGNPFSVSEITKPEIALDSEGQSRLNLISESDDLSYVSLPATDEKSLTDELFLTFHAPEGCKAGKLILRARNSFLVDYSYEKYLGLFGDKLAKRQAEINKKPAEKLQKWVLDQHIPLSVYLEQNGEWKFIDYFNVPGPMAFRDDIMKINLPGTSQNIKIKLETGKLFWEIDWVGMDFSDDYNVSCATVKPFQAIDQDSSNVIDNLLFDDENYLIQPNIGDETELVFQVPDKKEGLKRSVFLHSKGHYYIPGIDQPGRSSVYMYRFTKPQSFTRFVQKNYSEILEACQ